MDITQVDLNLLVAFEALLATGSVTRAGARVGLSQPAMSAALARLRALSGDPLFVRTRGGMLATARAERLGEAIAPALATIRGALDDDAAFDPKTTRRTFVLAASEAIGVALAPRLARDLGSRAPHASLKLVAFSAHAPPDELERGSVDVALGLFRDVPAGYRRRVLFRERLVSVVRKGHLGFEPAVTKPRKSSRDDPPRNRPMTLEAFTRAAHVLVSPRGKDKGSVDVALAARGVARRVVIQVPHLMTAVALLRASDLILTVGETVAAELIKDDDLRAFAPPIAFEHFDVSALWHERAHRDPAHAWLRSALYLAANGILQGASGADKRRKIGPPR